jgi:hypothetical protein
LANPKPVKNMSETIPPPLESAVQPKTTALAIWSPVLGILSLLCFTIFAGIPGVICGHKALSKIKRSQGAFTGQGLAIADLITGYLGFAWAIIFITFVDGHCDPQFCEGARHGTNECLDQ